MTTHVLFILDASGSMDSLGGDVRGGFNGWLDQALADGADYRMTVTTFNTEVTRLYENVPVAQAARLDENNYRPSGYTALWDAVGMTLASFRDNVVLAEGDKVLVHIETDGLENSSREHSAATLRPVLDELKAKDWAFVFAGTGLTDWSDAHASGLHVNMSANAATGQGTASRYAASYATTKGWVAGLVDSAKFSDEVQRGIDERGGNP